MKQLIATIAIVFAVLTSNAQSTHNKYTEFLKFTSSLDTTNLLFSAPITIKSGKGVDVKTDVGASINKSVWNNYASKFSSEKEALDTLFTTFRNLACAATKGEFEPKNAQNIFYFNRKLFCNYVVYKRDKYDMLVEEKIELSIKL